MKGNDCCQGGTLVPLKEGQLRCVRCGSIWYRIDPREKAKQGAAGAAKRWAGTTKKQRREAMQQVRKGPK